MLVVVVGATTGFVVALILVVLLAWVMSDHGRRPSRPSPRWVPAGVVATYPEAQALCRLLRGSRHSCRLLPAAERVDLREGEATSGVVALVPAPEVDDARDVLNSRAEDVDPAE